MLDHQPSHNPEQSKLVLWSDNTLDSYPSWNNNLVLEMQSILWTWVKEWNKFYCSIRQKPDQKYLGNFSLESYYLPALLLFFFILRNNLTKYTYTSYFHLLFLWRYDSVCTVWEMIIILQSFVGFFLNKIFLNYWLPLTIYAACSKLTCLRQILNNVKRQSPYENKEL